MTNRDSRSSNPTKHWALWCVLTLVTANAGCSSSTNTASGIAALESSKDVSIASDPTTNEIPSTGSREIFPNELTKLDSVEATLDPLASASTTDTTPRLPADRLNPSRKASPNESASIASREDLTQIWMDLNNLPWETWEVQYVGNQPIGYTRQKISPSKTRGTELLSIEMESLIRVSRSGKSMEQKLEVLSLEKPSGEFERIEAVLTQGESVTSIVAMPSGILKPVVNVTTTKDGQVTTKSIPWKREYRGPFATEQSMLRTPMVENEVREFKYFDPMIGELVDARLEAGKSLSTPIFGGSSPKLVEVRSAMKIGPNGMQSTLWVDDSGSIKKSYLGFLDIRSFRCSEDFATSIKDAARWDLTSSTSLNLPTSIEHADQARAITFRIRSSSGDPKDFFSQRTNQTIRVVDPSVVDVTCHSIRGMNDFADGLERESAPDQKYLQPSSLIQSDDARVVQLAKKMTEGASTKGATAKAISVGVFREITKKDFTKAFASAADVAKNLQGDCTEHAVLAAAIARAVGIPSRLANGLVYTQASGKPTMAYHMWTELWIDSRWIPIDATTGEAPSLPNRIKISETPLSQESPYGELLSVASTMGQIQIESVEIHPK